MTVFVYVNSARQVGDKDHVKLFATVDAPERWLDENDREGVAFEYDLIESRPTRVSGRQRQQPDSRVLLSELRAPEKIGRPGLAP